MYKVIKNYLKTVTRLKTVDALSPSSRKTNFQGIKLWTRKDKNDKLQCLVKFSFYIFACHIYSCLHRVVKHKYI